MSTNLLSFPSLVESPFIVVTIGNYTFGTYTKKSVLNKYGANMKVTYPNYLQSLNIVKINGTVNTYSLKMIYGIKQGDDPNLLDKVFSTVSNTRKLKLSYGDWNSPSFIFKEEEAIITKITSNVNFASSQITYNINCTSTSLTLSANKYDFPKRTAKPSDVIKELLYNRKYGLLDVFYGMVDRSKVLSQNLITSDDRAVIIEAKRQISPLDYLSYLVSCMIPISTSGDTALSDSMYVLMVDDNIKGDLNGPFFRISRTYSTLTSVNFINTFEIDVGYPGNNYVTNFSLKDDQSWSILYNYSQNINQSNYIYRIDNEGNLSTEYSPSVSRSTNLMRTTAADRAWWSNVTQFPIQASIQIKGLLRPAILMSYVKINAMFYGQKHSSSGLYIITKQEDSIDSSGYKTTLSLTRISGDYDSYVFRKIDSVNESGNYLQKLIGNIRK